MALTDMQARKATSREKDYKLSDSGGLYLFVTKSGGKSWRFKYRYAGKEKRLVFGRYPEVGLADARDLRDGARRLLREHRDPAVEDRRRRMAAHASAGMTFEVVARRWHAEQASRWSPLQSTKVRQALERDVFPQLGRLPLIDIDPPIVLAMLRRVEDRGAIDTAKRIRQHVSAVFCFGIAEGLCASDPAASIARALKPTPRGGRQPAVRTLAEARTLLADMEATTSHPLTKLASRLLALTVVRPGVVRAAVWSEFEGIGWASSDGASPDAVWRIPAERMKLALEDKADEAFEHVVPLAPEAVAVLRAIRRMNASSASTSAPGFDGGRHVRATISP